MKQRRTAWVFGGRCHGDPHCERAGPSAWHRAPGAGDSVGRPRQVRLGGRRCGLTLLLGGLPGSARDGPQVHLITRRPPPTPVPHGDGPSAESPSVGFRSVTPLPQLSVEAEPLCQVSGFSRKSRVGLTRGRAGGGISGPLFRQLPFPGVSPQPPQLPSPATLRPGGIRRAGAPGDVSRR